MWINDTWLLYKVSNKYIFIKNIKILTICYFLLVRLDLAALYSI